MYTANVYRSHVDLGLFVRFVHVRRDQIPPEVLEMLLNGGRSDTDLLSRAWASQMASTSQITFHETYHFWQGLRLPFLYRYALLSYKGMITAFKRLSESIQDLHDWDCILPELERLGLKKRIWGNLGGSLTISGSDSEELSKQSIPLVISPLDLLEGATSIAEFQVHTKPSEQYDARVFSRWIKRNPAYVDAFGWLAKNLGDEELALRCFIPLINAAFHTTEPVRAFATLAQYLWNSRPKIEKQLSLPEPLPWEKLFQNFLSEINYEAPLDSDAKLLGSPYQRLTLDAWVFSDLEHPFLSMTAKKWIEKAKDDPRLDLLLSKPGHIEEVADFLVEYAPACSFVRFHIDGINDRVITTVDRSFDEQKKFSLKYELSLYSAVRRASGSHYDGYSRLCHHENCPEYAHNYCNCFPGIPAVFEDCSFLQYVEELRNGF